MSAGARRPPLRGYPGGAAPGAWRSDSERRNRRSRDEGHIRRQGAGAHGCGARPSLARSGCPVVGHPCGGFATAGPLKRHIARRKRSVMRDHGWQRQKGRWSHRRDPPRIRATSQWAHPTTSPKMRENHLKFSLTFGDDAFPYGQTSIVRSALPARPSSRIAKPEGEPHILANDKSVGSLNSSESLHLCVGYDTAERACLSYSPDC